MDGPRYEFDRAKDALNRVKHGFSLALGVAIMAHRVAEILDVRPRDEERYGTFGLVSNRLYACVWTRRHDVIRITSVRKANRKEQARWLTDGAGV